MSKERLEEIKQYLIHFHNTVDVEDGIKAYIFNILKIEWLIEQAERVEELQLEVNDWKDEAIKWNIRFRESEESHLETKELLHSTIREIKRYQETLNNIITLWTSSTDETYDTWLAHKMSEVARKAMDEIL